MVLSAKDAVVASECYVNERERPVERPNIRVVDVIHGPAEVAHRTDDVPELRALGGDLKQRDLEQHELAGLQRSGGTTEHLEFGPLDIHFQDVRRSEGVRLNKAIDRVDRDAPGLCSLLIPDSSPQQ